MIRSRIPGREKDAPAERSVPRGVELSVDSSAAGALPNRRGARGIVQVARRRRRRRRARGLGRGRVRDRRSGRDARILRGDRADPGGAFARPGEQDPDQDPGQQETGGNEQAPREHGVDPSAGDGEFGRDAPAFGPDGRYFGGRTRGRREALACRAPRGTPFRSRPTLGTAFLLLGGAARAQQGGEFLGVDPAAAGRAGVDLGFAEGALSIGTNPAGLAFLRAGSIDGATRLFFSRVDYTNGGEHEESLDRVDLAPYLGLAWPRVLGPVSFGIAFLPESGFRSKIRLDTAAQAGPGGIPPTERATLETDSSTFAASPAIAFPVTETLALGLAGIVETTSLSVRGFTEQPVSLFAGEVFSGITFGEFLSMSGFTIFQSNYDLEARGSPSLALRVGGLWKPSPGWAVGAFYRSASTRRTLRGDVTVDMSTQFGDPGFDPFFPDGRVGHYDVKVHGYRLPQSAGFGLAWVPADGWRVGADVKWTDWSRAFDRLRFELDDGDNAGFNTVIGDDGFDIVFPLKWRDVYAGALGVERAVGRAWTLRGGVAANTNPVPSGTAGVYAPGFARFHAALGATRKVAGFALHAAYLHSFREEVRVGSSEVASDFDGARLGVAVDSLVLGASVSF